MNNKDKAKSIIENNLYMTIAVSNKNCDSWIANLYYAYDKNYNFYWYSSKESLHSQYIEENSPIAISIFDSTAVGDDVDAVYIKAKAQEVKGKIELLKGLAIYSKKLFDTNFVDSQTKANKFAEKYKDFQELSKLRLYKAEPIKVWKLAPSEMFNDKYVDSRIEVNLNN